MNIEPSVGFEPTYTWLGPRAFLLIALEGVEPVERVGLSFRAYRARALPLSYIGVEPRPKVELGARPSEGPVLIRNPRLGTPTRTRTEVP